MAIIISENGKNAERIKESQFGLEDKLQQYIYDNPDAIPLYDIDEDTRLFIAAREFSTKSGPIDALGFDASGNIYVIETKLYKNPDKRTVVAQALDYGASLWRHATDFDNFTSQLDVHCQKEFGANFTEKYMEFFQLDSSSDVTETIKANLADGRIKFVVLMDKLHEALKDLVVFVNQNSKFDLYAVELEYYKHKSYEIIIPKLFGAEVKKELSSSSSGAYSRKPITQEELLARLSPDEQLIAQVFINTASVSNDIGITWRKTGFSLWTPIPSFVTKDVYEYDSNFAYLFFQVSENNGQYQKVISFWYTEAAYEGLDKLREYIASYRDAYHSLEVYDVARKELLLADMTSQDAQSMVDHIIRTGALISSLSAAQNTKI